MTTEAIVPLVLTVLLGLAVVLRVADRPGAAPAAAARRGPVFQEVDAPRIDGIESLVVDVPWCPQPVRVLLVPAWLSAVDLRALAWPGPDAAAVYAYAGHRLPAGGVNLAVTAPHFAFRLAEAMRLGLATAETAFALKLFVPLPCETAAEPRLPALIERIDTLRAAARRSGSSAE